MAEILLVSSSFIRSIEYDAQTLMLIVQFKDGNKYSYYRVPPGVVGDFKNAVSKGEYYSKYIKGNYGESA